MIETKAHLRDRIQRMEALAGVLRMSGHPLASLPDRDEIADLLDEVAAFNRRCFDPTFIRAFQRRAA